MIPIQPHAELRETRSTCPYCGVGCGVIIESSGAQITGVRGDPEHPANFGRLCSKGSTLHLTASPAIHQNARLLSPMQGARGGATPVRIGWDIALQKAAEGFADIIHRHGADAVGFYGSGQLLTEDYYLFNKLAKGLIGTNNIDTNSRLCMSSAVAGYKQSLGSDAPPACYDDLQHAQTLFIAGSNTAYAHPVLFRRIEDAKRANPALRMVVCDPRRTDTAEAADLHLALQPGTDVMLFNGMLHTLLWEGWIDTQFIASHTTGFEALKDAVRDCTPDLVARTCGIDKADLLEASRLFAQSKATLSLYCQGLNQSSRGTAKNTALINLHLACGQIGRPGAGPFSLTGQPNAMGGREVGGMATLLSAHRDLNNPAHRAEIAALWGVEEVPSQPGMSAVEMFQAAADGHIRALWIACTNPAQSMPDQATVRRALERAELVVVQEAFANTATCRYADLLLPATTWGEKEGTVTNSERRISRVRAALSPPGEARHDWQIALGFAKHLPQALHKATGKPWPRTPRMDYDSAEAIWLEHRESTRGRDLDITGMSYALLEQAPQQWPMPQGAGHGQARLYQDFRFATPDGRARFVASAYQGVAEPRSASHPFALNTGRLRDQWHGMSRTGNVGALFSHAPEACILLHPSDMQRKRLKEGDLVRVSNRRGAMLLPVQAGADVGLHQAFIAMHWGDTFVSGRDEKGQTLAGVNALTNPAFCPDSKQPEFKHAAVGIDKVDLPWSLVAMAWLTETESLAARARLQALMPQFAFASCTPFATPVTATHPFMQQHGLLFRASHSGPPSETILQALETLLRLDGAQVIRYRDDKGGQRRTMGLQSAGDNSVLQAFVLAGDTRAQAWLSALWQQGLPAQKLGRALLSGAAQAPLVMAPVSRTVCTCLQVTEEAIQQCLSDTPGDASERLSVLQGRLHCGTQCGSCVPQLKRMVRASQPAALLA